jgi:hypothetical protein
MRFATPAGLAAALLAAPLVLWYVLRSRRPPLLVASTYLWARTERSVSAAVPWERFRPDRTFWLVLAALLIGAVALARPVVPVAASLGDHTIVVVDASGSMLADEDGPSRLELALREVRELADRLGPGQAMSVIEAGPRARTLVASAEDASAVRRGLARVRPSHAAADLADAFTLAGALQRPGQATVTHVWTDRMLPPEVLPFLPPGLAVHPVGSDRPNLAITRLQAVPAAGGAEAFVQVRSYATVAMSAEVAVAVAGDVVVERQVALPPRGTQNLVLPLDVPSTGAGPVIVHGRVTPAATGTGAAADALAHDDDAWAVLAGTARPTVLIAGPGNLFLEAAFGSVEGVEVRTAPGVPDDLAAIDLLVVDRIPAPGRASAAAAIPTLYVAPTRPPEGVTVSGTVDRPALTRQDPAHDLLRDVDLSVIAVAEAQVVSAPELTPVADGPSGPLLLAGRLGATPVAYLAFDLQASNLPVQVAWPVLVANAVTWLAGPPAALGVEAGSEAVLTVPAGVERVVVEPPGGEAVHLDPVRPRLLVDTVGLWNVRYEAPPAVLAGLEPPAPIAVQAARDQGDLMAPRSAAGAVTADPRLAGEAADGVRALGRVILAGVLALLLIEWLGASGMHPLRRTRRLLGDRRRARIRGAGVATP